MKELHDKDVASNGQLFRLCNVARYKNNGDPRTCFEKHHETAPDYPKYTGCMQQHKNKKKDICTDGRDACAATNA